MNHRKYNSLPITIAHGFSLIIPEYLDREEANYIFSIIELAKKGIYRNIDEQAQAVEESND